MPFLNSFVSSSSSFNPALAWSLGNGGKGYFIIAFPFALDSGWYQELPCTTFRTFQHRKEREGRIRHEFIVLKLSNDSVCRVERMGDPNARLNALATQGSMAQDLAQYFASENEAHLDSSEIISEVTLPCEFEIQDVLKICRAIKEGEKTRNYTLQVYNCYFFSLAIQACLTRFIAYWEDSEHFAKWHLRANEAIEELNKTDQALSASGSSPYYHVLFKILSIISSRNNQESSSIMDIKSKLQQLMACSSTVQRDIKYRVNNLLWYSAISSSLDEFVEENVIEAVLDTLQERFSEVLTSGSFKTLEKTNSQLPSTLTRLVARAGGTEWPKSDALTPNKLKQKQIFQLGAGLQTLKQDTRLESHTHVDPAAGTSISWPWVQYLVAYFLWVLHIVLLSMSGITLLEVSGAPTIAIEKWLDDIAAKLEHSGTIKCPGPESVIQDIHILLKDQRAIWNKSPWNSIYISIKDYIHARANVLEYLEESKPTIGVRFGDAKTELNICISSFQEHIIERVKMQAKEVEGVWLGSSAKIQIELKETLSQVWRMIREDAGITEKVVQINHQVLQNLELLSVQDLEAQVASWRERLPNLESRVRELSDVVSRPDAQPEAMTEYARAKQELDQNKILFAKAQAILNDRQFQATQAQAVNVDGPSRQTVIPRDRTAFLHLMRVWFVQSGHNSYTIPKIGEKPLDLHQLYIEVETLGGPEKVQAAGLWRLVAIKMGYITHEQIDSQLTQIAKVLANAYATLIVPFDSFCLDRMRAVGNGIQNNRLNLELPQAGIGMGAPGGLRPGGVLPGGDAINPVANFQRILAFLQVTLKDWLPDLNPQAKLLRAAQMDVPEMQRQGWPPERIIIIQRFRPALMQYRATLIRQQELQKLSQGQHQQLAEVQAHQQQHTQQPHANGQLPPNTQAHNPGMAGVLELPLSPGATDLVVEPIAHENDHSREYPGATDNAGIDAPLAPHPDEFERELDDLGIDDSLLSSLVVPNEDLEILNTFPVHRSPERGTGSAISVSSDSLGHYDEFSNRELESLHNESLSAYGGAISEHSLFTNSELDIDLDALNTFHMPSAQLRAQYRGR